MADRRWLVVLMLVMLAVINFAFAGPLGIFTAGFCTGGAAAIVIAITQGADA
jgi:hypothetical protein